MSQSSFSVYISDGDFKSFNDLHFEDYNNNIGLPAQNNMINISHSVDPFGPSHSPQFDASRSSPEQPQKSTMDDIDYDEDTDQVCQTFPISRTVIPYSTHNPAQSTHLGEAGVIMTTNPQKDVEEAENDDEISMDALDFFGQNGGDLQPVPESQLQDYFNHLAQQFNDGEDVGSGENALDSSHPDMSQNRARFHESDEDCEWFEHDRENLDQIKSQHDEKHKIKPKTSKILITLKSPSTTGQFPTKAQSTQQNNKKELIKPKLLILPVELSGLVQKAAPLNADIAKLLHNDEFDADFDDIAMENDRLDNWSRNGPLSAALTAQNDTTPQDHLNSTQTTKLNKSDNFDNFFFENNISMDLERREKQIALQRLRIQQQKARLAKKVQSDEAVLKQQQAAFLAKITQYQDELKQIAMSDPLGALGILVDDGLDGKNGVQIRASDIDADCDENTKIAIQQQVDYGVTEGTDESI